MAITLLSPGGMVRVRDERLHAFTEGVLINMGEPIEVVAVRGTAGPGQTLHEPHPDG